MARLPRQLGEDQAVHLNVVFTLKHKDGTGVAIMLIISSLIVRAGRANAFVSSAVPFLPQMNIAWMLKPVCRGLSSGLSSKLCEKARISTTTFRQRHC